MNEDRQPTTDESNNVALPLPGDWPPPKFQFGQEVRLLPDKEIHHVIGLVCQYFRHMAHLPCKGYAWFYMLSCSSESKQLLFDEDELTAVRRRTSGRRQLKTNN
jgi:hypothetical protein